MRSRHTVTATVFFFFEDRELNVIDGSITMDDRWAPYIQGRITCKPPADWGGQETWKVLDPLNTPRIITLTLTQSFSDWNGSALPDVSIDLKLNARVADIDDVTGVFTLDLASLDAQLQDYRSVEPEALWMNQTSFPDLVNVLIDQLDPPGELEAGQLEATNLVTNPGFEVDTTGWGFVGAGTISRVTTESHSGDASLRAATTANSSRPTANPMPGGTPSAVHTASCWVKGEAGKSVRALLYEYTTSNTQVGVTTGPSVVMTGDWQRVDVSRTFGATGTKFAPAVQNMFAGAHTFYVDDVMVELGATASNYFDGDTPAGGEFSYRWTGTADLSASEKLSGAPADPAHDQFNLFFEPGQSIDEFLEPVLQEGGLRLYADEEAKWRLVFDPTAPDPGATPVVVEVAENLIGSRTKLTRDEDEFANAVIITYEWRDEEGDAQIQHDIAYDTGWSKAIHLRYRTQYPGPGAAAKVLARSATRGWSRPVTAPSDYTVRPGMPITITAANLTTAGYISAVTWSFPENTMEIVPRDVEEVV